ncbi:uncharacterized protein LOC126997511 [Eriocheir sinensis]|uniref:uncharacterized protein LOC126997511 n=1 Tax=Eriocheir sinensis TaxID=95602 RepID=UPI0021C8B234|nr:uncharacterized protein LOC126997511 [Eriocheir sinensis]
MEKAAMTLTIGKLIHAVTLCCLAIGSGKVHSRVLPTGCSDPGCSGVQCEQGFCGAQCECECLPCFTGPACAHYEDLYGPRFAIREDTVILEPHHTGVVYKAVAEDEDLGLTCPLGPGRNTRCPCASIRYHLLTPGRGQTIPHSLFTIHASSGQVFLRPGTTLEPSARHQALIVASTINGSMEEGHRPHFDVQTLTVVVRQTESLHDLLQDPLLYQTTRHLVQDGSPGTNFTRASNQHTQNDVHYHDQEHDRRQNTLTNYEYSSRVALTYRHGDDDDDDDVPIRMEKQVTTSKQDNSYTRRRRWATRSRRSPAQRPRLALPSL